MVISGFLEFSNDVINGVSNEGISVVFSLMNFGHELSLSNISLIWSQFVKVHFTSSIFNACLKSGMVDWSSFKSVSFIDACFSSINIAGSTNSDVVVVISVNSSPWFVDSSSVGCYLNLELCESLSKINGGSVSVNFSFIFMSGTPLSPSGLFLTKFGLVDDSNWNLDLSSEGG